MNESELTLQSPFRTLYFATSSQVKFSQYECIFRDFGVSLRKAPAISSTLIEPQIDTSTESDQTLLVSHPLRQISRFVSKLGHLPYMVEDTMLFIERFSKDYQRRLGLPGADTKNWWVNLGADGVLELLKGSNLRGALFVCQIGIYLGGSRYIFTDAELLGGISKKAMESEVANSCVPFTNPFFFHRIFVPHGLTKTIAQLDSEEFSLIDYRRKCVGKLMRSDGFVASIENLQPEFNF